jgi:hypothetical protein
MTRNRSDEIELQRRIKTAGVPIEPDLGAQLRAQGLRIEPLGGLMANHVIDVRRGGTLYQAYLRVTCEVSGPVYVKEVQLTVLWDDSIELLSDPAEGKAGKQYYELRNGDSFERDQCLNHQLFLSTALRRGSCIEGFLLAEGMGQLPTCFPERSQVKALFTIVDQFSEPHSAELQLAVERIEIPKMRYGHATGSLPLEKANRELGTAGPTGDSQRRELYIIRKPSLDAS